MLPTASCTLFFFFEKKLLKILDTLFNKVYNINIRKQEKKLANSRNNMKTYWFNTHTKEYKIKASNLHNALEQLVEKLVSDNEPFKVHPYYYCGTAKTIPTNLYKKYLSGYSY